ncbi:MAG: hypothetical protein JW976_01965 [Syntrophaceae bacterium]|nr:hypothetical protein [Syntrophaceae bacterium]
MVNDKSFIEKIWSLVKKVDKKTLLFDIVVLTIVLSFMAFACKSFLIIPFMLGIAIGGLIAFIGIGFLMSKQLQVLSSGKSISINILRFFTTLLWILMGLCYFHLDAGNSLSCPLWLSNTLGAIIGIILIMSLVILIGSTVQTRGVNFLIGPAVKAAVFVAIIVIARRRPISVGELTFFAGVLNFILWPLFKKE